MSHHNGTLLSVTNVISIQSHVAFGHAGNSAAVFPLQRQGVDVIDVLTVNFSNHTGYGAWTGTQIAPTTVREIVHGVADRGALTDIDAILTGYLGAQEMGEVIVESAAFVKEQSPEAIWCCDPVMGDVGRGFFVMAGIPEYFRDVVVPLADVMTPNQFELNFLTGREETSTMAEVLAAVAQLRQRGPSTVLVTSVITHDTADDELTMVAVGEQGAYVVRTPRLVSTFTGSGDLTAATFLTHLLRTNDVAQALERTAAIVYGVLELTQDSGKRELQLVAGQEELVNPSHSFVAAKLH